MPEDATAEPFDSMMAGFREIAERANQRICKIDNCPYCGRNLGHHPNLLIAYDDELGEYVRAEERFRWRPDSAELQPCTARWATYTVGAHNPDEVCGEPATEQYGDVWLCNHHAKRMRKWAADFVREKNEERHEYERRYEEEHRWDPTGPSVVYYMRRSDGLIKIGVSTCVARRKRDLEREHGQLELLATHRGSYDVEGRMHDRFSAHWVTGEWFQPHRDLLAWIERIKRRQESSHDERNTAA